jgi:hypothetical protein
MESRLQEQRTMVRVWEVLDEQGREIKWLARQIGVSPFRLYRLKAGGAAWWRYAETVQIAAALGVPYEDVFPAGSRVMPPGRLYPVLTRDEVA